MTARCFGCDSLVEPIDGLCPSCGASISFRQRTGGAKEARPDDVDKNQNFPIGIGMKFEGRKFRYFKADHDMKKGEIVTMPKENE